MTIRTATLLVIVLICTVTTGCSKHKCKKADDRVQAAVWMHNAAEYQYIAETTYRSAGPAMIKALEDTSVTASLEQEAMGDYEELPPAVVLDLDETVINNGPFQGHIIRNGKNFNYDTWKKWSDLEDAKPLSGAVEFLKFARDNGVTPIFLSNRMASEESATIINLANIGIPTSREKVLLKDEDGHEDWTSDKRSRREYIAQSYRILLLVGDDLNDFVSVKGLSTEQRDKKSKPYKNRFGKTWFILPNPSYGTWEPSIFGGKYIGKYREEHDAKINALPDFEEASATK